MIPEALQRKLDELIGLPSETEWVEFKEAKNNKETIKSEPSNPIDLVLSDGYLIVRR